MKNIAGKETQMVFIAGFEKCGTTTLHGWLDSHPAVCASRKKEPRFFEREFYLGERYYQDTYFKHLGNEEICVDARPYNAIIPYCAPRIKQMYPGAKIILMIREPIARAYSGWSNWQRMRPGREPLDFYNAIQANKKSYDKHRNRELVDGGRLFSNESEYVMSLDPGGGTYHRLYIENSMYMEHINRFVSLFGIRNVRVVSLDETPNSNKEVYAGVCNFLGIDATCGSCAMSLNVAERSTWKRVEREEGGAYSYLSEIFKPDTIRLSRLLGDDLIQRWYS